MNIFPYLVLFLGSVSLTFFIITRDKKGSAEALLLKTITSFLFISVAFTSYLVNPGQNAAPYSMFIMMGLVSGLVGDIILDLKVMYRKSSSIYQHGGMIAFFIGHLFYLSALFIYFGFSWIPLFAAFIIAAIILLISKFIFKFKFKEHTIDTYLYSIILSYMMTQSCYSAYTQGFTASTGLLAAGSILFLLSDLVLVMIYYDKRDSKPFIAANHILYYAAQFIIALSILYI